MTMSCENIRALVEAMYETAGRGDFAAQAKLLADDFVISEGSHLPMAGHFSGPTALEKLYAEVMALFDVGSIERVSTAVSDDGTAICELRMHFAQAGLAPADLCELFRFRDGKCYEIKPYYFDTAALNAAIAAKKTGTVRAL